ncbi:MAG TPA: DUF4403 family protein [Gemmatimonas sp.]|nr:DUF4403 family protein [Gemmatimonas sp.]
MRRPVGGVHRRALMFAVAGVSRMVRAAARAYVPRMLHRLPRPGRTLARSTFVGSTFALFTLGILQACSSESIAPIAPLARSGATAVKALPDMPLSVVDAPVSYALTPALEALERAVPRKFGDIEKRLTIPSNKRQQVAFAAARTPFAVKFDGRRLTIETTVTYSGRGWYDPVIGPTISASCGTDSTPPRLRVVLVMDVDVASDWNLRTKTRLSSVEPATTTARDGCRVSAFQIDVTDKVVNSIRPLLTSKLSAVDAKIAAFDLSTRITKWYNLLNRGIRVTDSLWLVLAPQGVRLGSLSLADTALVANIRLYARPFMVSGPKPPTMVSKLPTFDRASQPVGDSVHLRLEGLLNYDDASAKLSQKLVGRTFRRFNQSVTIDKVRLYALGDGRVVLAVAIKGGIAGEVFLTGTPKLDTVSRTLTVPDLEFDVATADALVRGLAWLKNADMVTTLRERAQLPLDDLLDDTRAKVEKAMNRELTKGVALSGEVNTGRLVDVVAMPRWLVVRAEATGSLGLYVDRPIPAPKPRKAN